MFKLFALFTLAVTAQAVNRHYDYGYNDYPYYKGLYGMPYRSPVRVDQYRDETPKPFAFNYVSPAIGGASSRQETGDTAGRVTGSYSVTDEDGRSRVVEYVADEGGFRASVQTNEPGTDSQSPADVVLNSNAPATVYTATANAAAPKVVAPVRTVPVATGGLGYSTYGRYRGYNPTYSGSHYGSVYGNQGYYGQPAVYNYGRLGHYGYGGLGGYGYGGQGRYGYGGQGRYGYGGIGQYGGLGQHGYGGLGHHGYGGLGHHGYGSLDHHGYGGLGHHGYEGLGNYYGRYGRLDKYSGRYGHY